MATKAKKKPATKKPARKPAKAPSPELTVAEVVQETADALAAQTADGGAESVPAETTTNQAENEPVGTPPEPVAKYTTAPLTPEELAAYDAATVRLVSEAEDRAKAAESTYENSKEVASADKKRYEARVDELRGLIHERADNRGKRPKPEAPTLLDSIPKWKEYGLDRLTLDDATRAMLTEAGIATLGDLSDQIGPAYTDEAPSFGMTREVNDSIREQIHAIIDAEFKQPESDLYKQYPIDRWTRFGLTAKDVEKLHACETKGTATGLPIVTMGDLQRFVTPNPASPGYVQSVTDIKGIGDAGATRIEEAQMQFWGWWRAGGAAEFAAEINPPEAPEATPEQPVEAAA